MLFLIIKFLHVMFAIIAVGANATYGVWIARAARDPQHLPFAMRTIQFIDDRIANPVYGLLFISGIINVFVAGYPLTTFWIAAAIVLYVIVVILGFGVIKPNFIAQLRILEAEGASSAAFRAAAARGRRFGLLVTVIVIAIVFLMVVKPTV